MIEPQITSSESPLAAEPVRFNETDGLRTTTRLKPTAEAIELHNAMTRKTILEQREQRRHEAG